MKHFILKLEKQKNFPASQKLKVLTEVANCNQNTT